MKTKDIASIARERMGIADLNEMQRQTAALTPRGAVILIAPTGSGKTLAFAIPLLRSLVPGVGVKAVVMAPSRELVMQVSEVIRPLAKGFKTVALYGGHDMASETASLSVVPDIIVATPGRLVDHIRRGNVDLATVRTLVIDEYDKCLELGFSDEMRRVCRRLSGVEFMMLTSATEIAELPDYLPIRKAPAVLDFSAGEAPRERIDVVRVPSVAVDKLQSLKDLLHTLPNGRTVVFVNHRESADRVWKALKAEGFPVGVYHGGLDQNERENALEMLANGTTPVLVATDLGARGLDIPELASVIHYHLPPSPEAWTHRNGRTARQGADGTVYVIISEADSIPDYVDWDRDLVPQGNSADPLRSDTATLYLNVGRKDKISRGDIVGFLIAKGGLTASQIGRIMLRDHSALVAVPREGADALVEALTPHRIKNTRARFSLMR